MRRMAAIASGIMLLCAASSALPAQDDPCTTRTVLVTVIDRQGNSVTGLTAANFRGKFRGKPVEILSAVPHPRPPRIVLVVDASGSMAGTSGNWAVTTDLAADIFRNAPAYTHFALITFAGAIHERVGFTSETSVLARKLAALPKAPRGGRTSLYDALTLALVELSPPARGDTIYAITDGGDNSSEKRPAQLKTSFANAGVRFFAFMPLADFDRTVRTPKEAEGPSTMLSLAKASGGNVFMYSYSSARFTAFEEERTLMRTAARRFAREIWQCQQLEIRIPRHVDKPRDWKLEVVDNSGKRNRKLIVLYPRKLLPCSTMQEEQ